MAICFEPGDEIELDIPCKRRFFTHAKSWRQQKEIAKQVEAIKEGSEFERLDKAMELIVANVTRTEPPIEITAEALSDVLDARLIYELVAAIRFNSVTPEEKKS